MNATKAKSGKRNVYLEETSPEFNLAWQQAIERFDLAQEKMLAVVERKPEIPQPLHQRELCLPRRERLDVGRFVLIDCADEPMEMEIDSLKGEFLCALVLHHGPLSFRANKKLTLMEELIENRESPSAYVVPAEKPHSLQRLLHAIHVSQPLEFTIGAPREVPMFYQQFQEQVRYELKKVMPVHTDPDLVIARYADGRLFYGGNIDRLVVRPTSTVRLFLPR